MIPDIIIATEWQSRVRFNILRRKGILRQGHALKVIPDIIIATEWHSRVRFNILRRKGILRQGHAPKVIPDITIATDSGRAECGSTS